MGLTSRAFRGWVEARPETIPGLVLAEGPRPSASRSARSEETNTREAITIIPAISANPFVSQPVAHQGRATRASGAGEASMAGQGVGVGAAEKNAVRAKGEGVPFV